MKVTVKKKSNTVPVVIGTEFIKLESALKLANAVASGGEAKALIQEGEVTVSVSSASGPACTASRTSRRRRWQPRPRRS